MLTIGKLAASADVGVETVRFYQRNGLLDEPEPTGKVRYYGDQHIMRLRFIKRAQLAGFALKEIKVLLALDASDDRAEARRITETKLASLEQKIQELTSARDALKSLYAACASGEKGPCPILASFDY